MTRCSKGARFGWCRNISSLPVHSRISCVGFAGQTRGALLTHGDHYMHLADLQAYLRADERLCELYRAKDDWAFKSIQNIAGSGKFSSDRTIAEYAAQIWHAQPCAVR